MAVSTTILQKTIKPTRKTETDANPTCLASAHTKARTRADSVESAEFRIATQSLADVLQERAKTGHSLRFIGIVLVFVLPQEGFLILRMPHPKLHGCLPPAFQAVLARYCYTAGRDARVIDAWWWRFTCSYSLRRVRVGTTAASMLDVTVSPSSSFGSCSR